MEPQNIDFTINKINMHQMQGRLEYICQSPVKKDIFHNGCVVAIKATVTSGMQERQFLGFIKGGCVGESNSHFSIFVSMAHSHYNTNSKFVIIGYSNAQSYMDFYNAIYKLQHIDLFDVIINPTKLSGLNSQAIPQCKLGMNNTRMFPLDSKQNDVFKPAYNGIVEALTRSKGFVATVSGFPGSGKSRIIVELIYALRMSEYLKKKSFNILITGSSDDAVDSLALNLHKLRNDGRNRITAEQFQQLNFIRYGIVQDRPNKIYDDVQRYTPHYHVASMPESQKVAAYKQFVETAKIVFAPVSCLKRLTKYCNKFDVILFDNASEMHEMNSTPALMMNPSALVLFGDPARSPVDRFKLDEKYQHHQLNQSLFRRMLISGRCVLHLDSQHRFMPSVSRFLSDCFYNGKMTECRRRNNVKTYNRFGLFHRREDGFLFKFLERLFQAAHPTVYSYGLILPPNITNQSIDDITGPNRTRVMISRNITSTLEEKDIIVIWVNGSMKDLDHYRVQRLLPVMTRARHGVFIIGCTDILKNDRNWKYIFKYAERKNVAYDLQDYKDIPSHFLTTET